MNRRMFFGTAAAAIGSAALPAIAPAQDAPVVAGLDVTKAGALAIITLMPGMALYLPPGWKMAAINQQVAVARFVGGKFVPLWVAGNHVTEAP